MRKLALAIAIIVVVAIIATASYLYYTYSLKTNNVSKSIDISVLASRCIHLESIGKSSFVTVEVSNCRECRIVTRSIHIREIMLISGNRVECSRRVDIPLTGRIMISPPCMPRSPGVYKLCIKLSTGTTICKKNVLLVVMK